MKFGISSVWTGKSNAAEEKKRKNEQQSLRWQLKVEAQKLEQRGGCRIANGDITEVLQLAFEQKWQTDKEANKKTERNSGATVKAMKDRA